MNPKRKKTGSRYIVGQFVVYLHDDRVDICFIDDDGGLSSIKYVKGSRDHCESIAKKFLSQFNPQLIKQEDL